MVDSFFPWPDFDDAGAGVCAFAVTAFANNPAAPTASAPRTACFKTVLSDISTPFVKASSNRHKLKSREPNQSSGDAIKEFRHLALAFPIYNNDDCRIGQILCFITRGYKVSPQLASATVQAHSGAIVLLRRHRSPTRRAHVCCWDKALAGIASPAAGAGRTGPSGNPVKRE